MNKKVENMIAEVAKTKLNAIINSHTPSQYNSELLKDIKQDLYLAYYTIRKKSPNIHDNQVKSLLMDTKVTQPDSRVVYVGDNIENY